MEPKTSISKIKFFQAGKCSSFAFDLSESAPVFLSGPAGQGKEMIQALLTHWYAPTHLLLKSDDAHPHIILYEWAGAKKEFVSAHSSNSSHPVFILISGRIEESWGNDKPIPPFSSWKKELEKEGKTVSKVLHGLHEWDKWLTHQQSPLPKKQQEIFQSPGVNMETLKLLRFRPEPAVLNWEQTFANQLFPLLNVTDDFQQKILSYHQERATLLREEKLGRSLPGLRKWDNRKEQIRQERQFLTSQWPTIYKSHKQEWEDLQQNRLITELPLPEEERLEQLRMRLGWAQWEMENRSKHTPSTTQIDTPATWWQARKILDSELQELTASIREIQNQLSIALNTESTEDEVQIDSQIRRLDQQLPGKIATLERLKMKLEWLRKEKEEEEQTLKEVHRAELARLQHVREELESRVKELEAEARRPRNTFRHWLEKNYPDWEKGPGKVLHPAVLDSRGMFPVLERINELFFGIKIHLEELPEVEPEQTKNHPPGADLEQIRQTITSFQIQIQHEEKLLQNRYKQKIRPLQKSIQQAEYDLQLHSRAQHQLRLRRKEIRQHIIMTHEKNRLRLKYHANELKTTEESLSQQIEDLDKAWELWLEESSSRDAVIDLPALEARWKKEMIQQEKVVAKARKKSEADRLLVTAALDSWTLRDQRFSGLIASRELSAPTQDEPLVAPVTIDQWEQRWELMEAEEISWDQEHQSWIIQYPTLQEYLDLGLEEFEETGLAAKKSELARKWFGELSSILQTVADLRNTCLTQITLWNKWAMIWQKFTEKSSLSSYSPGVLLAEHPFCRAIDMLIDLIEDHQHAAAGAGLFNQQDPQQTLIRTLHVLDNLYEGWNLWKDGLTRMNLNILRLPGLTEAHHQETFNYLYHLSLLFSQPGHIPGLVSIPEPEKIPAEIIARMTQYPYWVICSQYPLAVKGDHLWVTESKKDKQWEALPFAMG